MTGSLPEPRNLGDAQGVSSDVTVLGRVLTLLPALALVASCSTSPSDPSEGQSPVSAATGDARTAAQAYLDFAESSRSGSEVPWADTVLFSIAGEQVAQLSPDFADRRSGWVRCPGGTTSYAGRACPVSPLATVWAHLRDGGEPVLDAEAPREVGCADYRVPWETDQVVWILPGDEDVDCADDYAIAIAVDDAGDVVAVDLTLGGR